MEEVPKTIIPCHIAVIMDGNGRWAAKRHMPRSYGLNPKSDAKIVFSISLINLDSHG